MVEDFYSNEEISGNFTKGTEPAILTDFYKVPEINRNFSFCQNKFIIGGPGVTGVNFYKKVFTNLPRHYRIKFSVSLFFIGKLNI
jgi:hypothetical protein